jgi:hypothetical protein
MEMKLKYKPFYTPVDIKDLEYEHHQAFKLLGSTLRIIAP